MSTQPASPALPKVLTDDPSEVDAFAPHGPHTVLARAVFDLIRQTPGCGLCIGLRGERGSGKSTVIRQIESLANAAQNGDAANVRVFTFDAWAHEGDPLRRAFLEELINFLVANASWLSSDFAKTQSANLKGRSTTTDRKTTSSLTPSGLWLAASGLLVPVGLGLMAGGFSTPGAAVPGLCLTVSPILVASFEVWRGRKAKKANASRGEYIRSIFANSSTSDEHTQSVTAPDPTSVEFREIFRGTLSIALAEHNRRLLIVLDNLDRLESPGRQAVLAVMRTYLDALAASDWPAGGRVWTLVPLPPQRTPAPDAEARQPAGPVEGSEEEKLFQISFTVPATLLSDWRVYLAKLLEEALSGWSADTRQLAVDLYESATYGHGTAHLTPRCLKQYVNAIVAIELASSNTPALSGRTAAHVATLAAIRTTTPGWRPTPKIPAWCAIPGRSNPRAEDIAALHYCCPPQKALQVMRGGDIDRALGEGNAEAIAALLAESRDLAPTIRLQVQMALVGQGQLDSRRIANAAAAIAPARATETDLNGALAVLANAAHSIPAWPSLDANNAKGLAAICDCDPSLAPKLFRAVGEGFATEKSPNDAWIAGALSLIETLAAGHGEALKNFRIAGTPSQYVTAMSSAALSGHDTVLSLLQPACAGREVIGELTSRAGDADDGWSRALMVCSVAGPSWDWGPLLQQIDNLLNQQNQPHAAALIAAALNIRKIYKQTSFLPQARAMWLFAHGSALSEPDRARWIAAILISNPNPDVHQNNPQINPGIDLYRRAVADEGTGPGLTAIADAIIAAEAELSLVASRSAWNPVDRVLKAIAEKSERFPTPADLITHGEDWGSILGQAGFSAWIETHAYGVTDAALVRAFDPALASIYLQLLDKNPERSDLSKFLDSGLRSMSTGQWLPALTEGGDLLALSARCLRNEPKLPAACPLQDALQSAAAQALQRRLKANETDLAPLLSALCADSASVLRRKMIETAVGSNITTTPMLERFGNFLAEWANPPVEVLTTFICKFIPRILERKDPAEMEWASSFAGANLDQLKATVPDCLADAVVRATSLASSDHPSASAANELVKSLGGSVHDSPVGAKQV